MNDSVTLRLSGRQSLTHNHTGTYPTSILCAPTILQLPLLLALQHALRLRQLQHHGKRLLPTSRTLYISLDDDFQDRPTPAYFLTTFDTDYVWRYFLRTASIPDPPGVYIDSPPPYPPADWRSGSGGYTHPPP